MQIYVKIITALIPKMTSIWQPSARLEMLQLRAQLYGNLRNFFAVRQVLEVETPILSAGCVPDPHIEPLYTDYNGPNAKRLFLQTSPELAMKRLLAAGSGPIFQIAKVFRDGEAGRWHNPEFSLLEWYRPGFNQNDLIQEIDELLQTLLHCPPAECLSYCAVFEQQTNLHPLHSPLLVLQDYVTQFGIQEVYQLDRDTCLQLILSHQIEAQLGKTCPTVITDFPATQAALARKRVDNSQLAERFEVYVQGIELANGFYELTDPVEQRQRFEQDLAKRQSLNLPTHPVDERFLAALEAGLPDCAGVALGLDRLLMLMAGASHIHEVLAFPIDCA
ncbi:EF-P lysine aminoacylase EpmA [Candidatus Parabeggiatoa sp. HSG14]|uniref:EF-P lysine aminoacylase EpmA n=1 Tax=Candidatus Parabeggiatoa sp. HSG14 TaxID=3055593 RepID=UPI0025A6E5A4|nr:EF-P lysine aminoacylase EpmA [Thiotrichales bacterium HSG14]